ncbi:MAG: TetR/AcrR family transcriptional regulator [Oscillospiraceae bacterium]|nr:TetR/AcrR family transcriptional regulator [Oscillospiraceae bacterium]
MPPKARITKEMVIEAGFDIVRGEGQESLNVRRIAAELQCSTQPVMYHYKTVDELKSDIYSLADGFHTEYIMKDCGNAENPMLSIGLNYIRFAEKEKYLFRFLFQSDKFRNISLTEMVNGEDTAFLIQQLAKQTGLLPKQARTVFETLFICVHGYAGLLANNSMEYNEKHCAEMLENIFMSTVGFMMRGEEK